MRRNPVPIKPAMTMLKTMRKDCSEFIGVRDAL
jgi:hypothetical protein